MESATEKKRRAHVITIDPDETVMTAFPYRPHNSLLDFLKGEPKVLGVSYALSWITREWGKGVSSPFLSTEVALYNNNIHGRSWSPFLPGIYFICNVSYSQGSSLSPPSTEELLTTNGCWGASRRWIIFSKIVATDKFFPCSNK